MKLMDLLEVINENTYVKVYNIYDKCIAIYDGKNNIPKFLNDFEVHQIYTTNSLIEMWKGICIMINTELTYDDVWMMDNLE